MFIEMGRFYKVHFLAFDVLKLKISINEIKGFKTIDDSQKLSKGKQRKKC